MITNDGPVAGPSYDKAERGGTSVGVQHEPLGPDDYGVSAKSNIELKG